MTVEKNTQWSSRPPQHRVSATGPGRVKNPRSVSAKRGRDPRGRPLTRGKIEAQGSQMTNQLQRPGNKRQRVGGKQTEKLSRESTTPHHPTMQGPPQPEAKKKTALSTAGWGGLDANDTGKSHSVAAKATQ